MVGGRQEREKAMKGDKIRENEKSEDRAGWEKREREERRGSTCCRNEEEMR